MKLSQTQRGFLTAEFTDKNGSECSIQKSSLATQDAIWLGVDNAKAQIMVSDARRLGLTESLENGWMDFDIPNEVLLSTRMHLTRKMVKELLPLLTKFVEIGELE